MASITENNNEIKEKENIAPDIAGQIKAKSFKDFYHVQVETEQARNSITPVAPVRGYPQLEDAIQHGAWDKLEAKQSKEQAGKNANSLAKLPFTLFSFTENPSEKIPTSTKTPSEKIPTSTKTPTNN